MYSVDGNDNFFSNPVPNAMATRDKNELSELKKLWFSAIINHPKEYFTHRINHFLSMLRIGNKNPAFVVNIGIDSNEYGFNYKENILSNSLKKIKESIPFLFFPWIYIILILSSTYIVLKNPRFKLIGICLASSAFGFILPHFFILPSYDYRYLFYFYICAVLETVLAATAIYDEFKKPIK